VVAFIIHRFFQSVLVMLTVTLIAFGLFRYVGDPINNMVGQDTSLAEREALKEGLGLNDPFVVQFGRFVGNAVQGEFGTSYRHRRAVEELIAERLPATLELMLGAMAVAFAIALPLGVLAALYHGRWIDYLASGFALLGVAIPNFWLGPLLILLFAIQLDWLPVNERGGLEHLVLPAITLGTALAALLSRMIHTSLVEVLGEDYIRTARAKGLPERIVVASHAMRNAAIPVITVTGLQIGALLSGAIITESIFDWPGLGSLLLEAIYGRNYALVQGCVLVIAVSYIAVNLLADLLYGWVDPRIRQA